MSKTHTFVRLCFVLSVAGLAGCSTLRSDPPHSSLDLDSTGRYLDGDSARASGGVSGYVDKYVPDHSGEALFESSKYSKYRDSSAAERLGGVSGYVDDLKSIDAQALEDSLIEENPYAEVEFASSGESIAAADEYPGDYDADYGYAYGGAGIAANESKFSVDDNSYFVPGSSKLSEEGRGRLNRLATEMSRDPAIRVRVEAARKRELSEERTTAVRDWLTHHGVARERIQVQIGSLTREPTG